MFKQSPSRNQRSKGFKVKHILQICVLLAVCFWLIYQVKHSHDKKKAFDETEAKISIKDHVHDEIVRLGRKDLHPRLEVGNERPDEEAEDDEPGAGEEDKQHEDDEQEEENKTEEKDDEGRGGGDDEIDEHDQDKSELEIEHEEELLDDEKEREIDEKENEDKEGQNEQESTSEDHDHGVSRNAHEAREEHYKADDASSAVTHETEAIDAAIKAESLENSDENNETDVLEEENKMNKTDEIWANQNNTGLAAGEGELTENGILRNVTEKEQEIQETVSSKPEESLISNSTVTTESNNEQQVVSNNTTEINPEINNLYLQNVTESKTGSVEVQNVTTADTALDGLGLQTISLGQQDNASHAALDKELPNSNSVVSHDTENAESTTEGSSNSSNATHLTTPESVQLEELSNVTQNEKAENSEGREVSRTDGRVDASKYENIEEIHHDPIDAVDTGVTLEKDVRTDLETLPEIITEGSNSEDAAAE